jgi:hypothetical protein
VTRLQAWAARREVTWFLAAAAAVLAVTIGGC